MLGSGRVIPVERTWTLMATLEATGPRKQIRWVLVLSWRCKTAQAEE